MLLLYYSILRSCAYDCDRGSRYVIEKKSFSRDVTLTAALERGRILYETIFERFPKWTIHTTKANGII